MPKIHPTAVVHPDAKLGDDVEVGPYCVIESDVTLGAGCVLREHVVVRRYTTLGRGNFLDAGVVLGGAPQDLKFDPDTVSYLRVGDDNVFREFVTVSRATGRGKATVIGSRTYWMACAHAGHEAVVEDEVILVNGAGVGGHAAVGRRAILSAQVHVHQFTWIGEMVMARGHSGFSCHVPPFVLCGEGINHVLGLNAVGLRRAEEITDEDRRQIKQAFSVTYRSGLRREEALARMDAHTEWGAPAGRFRQFIRRVHEAAEPYNRGLCRLWKRSGA